jgi:hypothetical protein
VVAYLTTVQALRDADMDALKNIADLHASLTKSAPLPISATELAFVLSADSPDALDEVIRRSGVGAPQAFEEEKKEAEEKKDEAEAEAHAQDVEQAKKAKPGKRVYWGLNVHGVKRKDLASKNDPDAKPKSKRAHEMPLLWQAARWNATRVIEYLNTPRPLDAFAYYAAHHNDTRAKKLRTKCDLAASYPEWIGWKADALGESAIVAAVCPAVLLRGAPERTTVATLEKLFELQPGLMREQLDRP